MFIIQKLETIHLSSSQKEVAQYILDKKIRNRETDYSRISSSNIHFSSNYYSAC